MRRVVREGNIASDRWIPVTSLPRAAFVAWSGTRVAATTTALATDEVAIVIIRTARAAWGHANIATTLTQAAREGLAVAIRADVVRRRPVLHSQAATECQERALLVGHDVRFSTIARNADVAGCYRCCSNGKAGESKSKRETSHRGQMAAQVGVEGG